MYSGLLQLGSLSLFILITYLLQTALHFTTQARFLSALYSMYMYLCSATFAQPTLGQSSASVNWAIANVGSYLVSFNGLLASLLIVSYRIATSEFNHLRKLPSTYLVQHLGRTAWPSTP